jgi:sugar O-acyltransferase (sialic acid O-acetyltransferase NeuD family)
MNLDLLSPSDPRWSKLLETFRHDFYHLPAYVCLEAERVQGEPAALYAEEGDRFLLLPLVFRKITLAGEPLPRFPQAQDAVSPYGYPGFIGNVFLEAEESRDFFERAFQGFQERLSAQGVACAFVRLHPLLNGRPELLASHAHLIPQGETVWIDLTQDESELWRQIRPRFRTYLNKLQRKGVQARMDESWQSLERFVDLYNQTMDQVEAESWYYFGLEYFRQLREALGPRIHLCVIEDEGEITSAGLFTECNGIVQYHLSGAETKHRGKHYLKFMLNFVRAWAKARGNLALHLGGGLGARADDLFQFKAGFSDLRATYYTWRTIFNSEIYQAAIRAWESKSGEPASPVEGYFPPYRKPFPLPAPDEKRLASPPTEPSPQLTILRPSEDKSSRRVVVIGCGGHGREMAALLQRMQTSGQAVEAMGFVDDNSELQGQFILGLPVLGGMDWVQESGPEYAYLCAIGNPVIRHQLVQRLIAWGVRWATLIDPVVEVPKDTIIGEGAMVCAGTLMTTNIRIGRHTIVNLDCNLSHDTHLEDFATLGCGVNLSGNVTIKEGAELGVGVNVIPGITIGEWAIVGAGATVIRDISARVTAVGVPARVIKRHG